MQRKKTTICGPYLCLNTIDIIILYTEDNNPYSIEALCFEYSTLSNYLLLYICLYMYTHICVCVWGYISAL